MANKIIVEAREKGDPRWVNPADQARGLNERRSHIIDRLRELGVISPAPAIVINVRLGSTKAEAHHG